MTDISETLRKEAELVEAEPEQDYPYRSPQKPRHPSQVYSLRIPPDRLEDLRTIADERGIPPATLLRQWVLERLDAEKSLSPEATAVRQAMVMAVTDALHRAAVETESAANLARLSVTEENILDLMLIVQAVVGSRATEAEAVPQSLVNQMGKEKIQILDLMEALKASVAETKARRGESLESRESA